MVYHSQYSYVIGKRGAAARKKLIEETGLPGGHAGGYETAVALHLFPQCVKLEMMLPHALSLADKRAEAISQAGLKTPVWWFAAHPHHYGGDGSNVTAEQGKSICEEIARDIAEYVRAVKADSTTMEIYREFREKTKHPEL